MARRKLLRIILLLLLGCWADPSFAERRAFTPAPGTALRTEIMDAARNATHTNERFIVGELVVLENGSASSAFAELVIESRSQEIGGLFLFRKIGGTWTALAMMGGGGGSRDCVDVIPIVRDFESEASKLGFAEQVLPKAFFSYRQEARGGGSSCHVAERLRVSDEPVSAPENRIDLKIGLPGGPFIKSHRDYHVVVYVSQLFQTGSAPTGLVKAVAQNLTHSAFDDAIIGRLKVPFDIRRVSEFSSLNDMSFRLEARVAHCAEDNVNRYASRQFALSTEKRSGDMAVAVEDIVSLCLEAHESDLSQLSEAMNSATQRLRR